MCQSTVQIALLESAAAEEAGTGLGRVADPAPSRSRSPTAVANPHVAAPFCVRLSTDVEIEGRPEMR